MGGEVGGSGGGIEYYVFGHAGGFKVVEEGHKAAVRGHCFVGQGVVEWVGVGSVGVEGEGCAENVGGTSAHGMHVDVVVDGACGGGLGHDDAVLDQIETDVCDGGVELLEDASGDAACQTCSWKGIPQGWQDPRAREERSACL